MYSRIWQENFHWPNIHPLLEVPIFLPIDPHTLKIPIFTEKRNHSPDAYDNDSASPNDAASTKSLIYSKIKRKIDPISMIKQ